MSLSKLFKESLVLNSSIQDELNKLGYDIELVSELGSGKYGTAFVTSDERVVKITNSNRESYVAKIIMEGKPDNVVIIYDVITLPRQRYAIIQELLFEIEQQIKIDFRSFRVPLSIVDDSGIQLDNEEDPNIWSELESYDWSHPLKSKIYRFLLYTKKYASDENAYKLKKDNIINIVNKHTKFVEDLSNGVDNLKEIGITNQDMRFENVMRDSFGNYKFIDIM